MSRITILNSEEGPPITSDFVVERKINNQSLVRGREIKVVFRKKDCREAKLQNRNDTAFVEL